MVNTVYEFRSPSYSSSNVYNDESTLISSGSVEGQEGVLAQVSVRGTPEVIVTGQITGESVTYLEMRPEYRETTVTYGDKQTDKNNANLNTAILDAWNALSTKEKCRKLFADYVDPIELLMSMDVSQNGLDSIEFGNLGDYSTSDHGTSTGVAAATTGVLEPMTRWRREAGTRSLWAGAGTVINNNSSAPWVAGFHDFLGVHASDRVYRALTIIHELGHAARMVYNRETASQINWDTNDAVNRANSQRVFDACFR